MPSSPDARVPRTRGALDPERLRKLPLEPVDGFILSCVDGQASITDLAQVTGLPLSTAVESVEKLALLGLVEFTGTRRISRPGMKRIATPPPRRATPVPRRATPMPGKASPFPRKAGSAPLPRGEEGDDPPPRASTALKAATVTRSARSSTPPKSPPPPRGSAPPRHSTPPRPSTPPRRNTPSKVSPIAPPQARVPSPPAPPPTPPPVASPPAAATALSATEVDLDLEHQRQIDEIFAGLGKVDHYALLGVPRDADKKAIKRAYFERTSRFHPDRFFRKRLGPFKSKMEALFTRMTAAHDALTRDASRAEYDAYLASVEKTRGIEAKIQAASAELKVAVESLAPPPMAPGAAPVPGEARATPAMPEIPRASPVPAPAPSSPGDRLSPTSATKIPVSAPATPPADRPSGARIRVDGASRHAHLPPPAIEPNPRDMLARRLVGSATSSNNMRAAPAAPPSAPKLAAGAPVGSAGEAVDALKRRYEERMALERTAQIKKYKDLAAAARDKKDIVAAANALRIASGLAPEDADLKASAESAQSEADRLLCDQYTGQATYEEKSEKWTEAARSWQRVARVRDADVRSHERAAYCLLKANGNLHEASAFAQKAAQLAPKDVQVRLTLAQVYLAAGLGRNARRELETAAQLAPGDASVQALLKKIPKPAG